MYCSRHWDGFKSIRIDGLLATRRDYVLLFLKACGLEEHTGALIDDGFDTLQALSRATAERLKEVGFAAGAIDSILYNTSKLLRFLDGIPTLPLSSP